MADTTEISDWGYRAIPMLIGLSLTILALIVWGDFLSFPANSLISTVLLILFILLCMVQLLLAFWVDVVYLEFSCIKKLGLGLLAIIGLASVLAAWEETQIQYISNKVHI
jgi:hypothetical protein